MITKPTVLVLGAGASVPYGFPSGPKLRFVLCDPGNDHWHGLKALVIESSQSQKGFDDFVEALRNSGDGTIDEFLEHQPETMRKIGKLAIAGALIPFESEYALFDDPEPERRWYTTLLDLMRAKPTKWSYNNVTVVTFNYDRSLETFILRALKSRYSLKEEEAVELAASLPIIHLHGQLGKLAPRAQGGRPYDTKLDLTSIGQGAEGIRIISDPKDDDAFTRAETAIDQADRVVFLGFGYADENLRRLMPNVPTGKWIGGTAFHLPPRDINRVKTFFDGSIVLGAREESMTEFLRDQVPWEEG